MRKKQYIKFGQFVAQAVIIRGHLVQDKWALPGGIIVNYEELKEIAKRHGTTLE